MGKVVVKRAPCLLQVDLIYTVRVTLKDLCPRAEVHGKAEHVPNREPEQDTSCMLEVTGRTRSEQAGKVRGLPDDRRFQGAPQSSQACRAERVYPAPSLARRGQSNRANGSSSELPPRGASPMRDRGSGAAAARESRGCCRIIVPGLSRDARARAAGVRNP